MNKRLIAFIRLIFIGAFVWISYIVIDDETFRASFYKAFSWTSLLIISTVYTSAFILRALAWKIYLKGAISLKWSIVAIFYSFVLNHILPIKAGDLIRAGVVTIHHRISYKWSLSSVILLRGLDLIILGSFALVGAFFYGYQISIWLFFLFAGGMVALLLIARMSRGRFAWIGKGFAHLRGLGFKNAFLVLTLTTLSWIFEGIVVYEVAKLFSTPLSYLQSVWLNSLTVAGQVFHFTPGGIGTYESVMTAVLTFMGESIKTGYSIALTTHLFKFVLSFVIGIGLVSWTPVPVQAMKGWIKRKGERS
jgi:uncharacterized membrane protein YbhN (UPF0104 family)